MFLKTDRSINRNFIIHKVALIALLFSVSYQAWSNETKQNKSMTNERIIALAPHITELVYSAGAGEKLVGVVEYSDFPIAARKLPIVGNSATINIESIIKLAPDVIIAWKSGNRIQDIERLQSLGFEVWQTDIQRLEDIPTFIQTIGERAGTVKTAQAKSSELLNILNKTKQQYANQTTIHAFYEIWHQPLMTMNGKQFISLAIETCQANNIFADLPLLASEVNLESVIQRDPQMILLGGERAFQESWYQDWLRYTELKAIKNQQIYKLDNDKYQRPTARLIEALPELCKTIDTARNHYSKKP